MRKPLFVAFLTAIMVGGFALAGTLHFGTVQAATEVTGIINSDTTWTKANSPYNFTGPILVSNGVTLTIEAGATVNLNSYYIRVAGTLRAQGSSTDQIHFNGGSNTPHWSIDFTESSTSWSEQTGSGCIIENAVIDSTHTGISVRNVTPKINNNSISAFYAIDVYEGSPVISNNIINGAIGIHYAFPTIIGNTIKGRISATSSVGLTVISNNTLIGGGQDINLNGITCSNAHVYNNVVYGFVRAGIVLNGNATIEKNLIMNNTRGLQISSTGGANPLIRYNTIANNSVGIETNNSPSRIIYNNIQNNIQNSVYHLGGEDIDVINNWWGTTDTQAIEQSIHDFEDDFNLGKINFVPFLTEPNPEAPATTSIPTPTPSPTHSPTPDQTPTPTPPQEPQQTQQFEAILGAAIAVAVIGAGLGLLIYLIKRK